MLLLKIFYIALFGAIIFFGSLQAYLYKKKSEWDLKKSPLGLKTDEPEKTGGMLSILLILLASAFLLWKMLTNTFTPI